jgi:RimJ/RimL family protein N-acetyltransferase
LKAHFKPDWPMATKRLLIRPLVDADAPTLLGYLSRPEVCRYIPYEPMTAEDVQRRLGGVWSRPWIDADGDAMIVGAEVATGPDAGRLAGDLMLRLASLEHSSAEIGYVFDPELGGHGYATEAAAAMVDLAFNGLGAHRVYARIDSRNLASIRLVERLGLRREAHLRENEWFKGEWTDELVYAVLDRDWGRP